MKRKFVILALAIGLPALVVTGTWLRQREREEGRWRDITAHVPSAPLLPSTKDDWIATGSSTGTYQAGQVTLGDGDVWRFAFASHHLFAGPDSYTVFKNHRDTIRVRGGGFCCEVEFYNQKQPADAAAFVALLRRRGDEVEILK